MAKNTKTVKTTVKTSKKKTNYGDYKCKVCSKRFSERAGLTHHAQLHSDERPFSCTLCPHTCKTKKYLTTHIKRVHNAAKEHACTICKKKFHYKSLLDQHMYTHTDERPYKCDVCGKGFNSNYSLSSHKLIHTDSKPFKCKFCDYACRDNSTLRKHHERHLGVTKEYQCKLCDKTYKTKSILKVHIAEVHFAEDMRNRECGECGKMFRSNANLHHHVRLVHERAYSCVCDICGAALSTRYNLAAHLAGHGARRPHRCDFAGCGKAFKDKGTLKKHNLIHYPERQRSCEVCHRRFARTYRLNVHRRLHHGGGAGAGGGGGAARSRERSVVCDHCGKSFYNKNYLRTHITKKHSNRQTYICDLCGLRTYNKPSIVMHIKYGHASEMDRQCKICKKTYKKHKYLKMHYWKTHCVKYNMMPRRRKTKKPAVIEEDSKDMKELELLHEVKVEPLSDVEEDLKITEQQPFELTEENTEVNSDKKIYKMRDSRFDDLFVERVMRPDYVVQVPERTVNDENKTQPDIESSTKDDDDDDDDDEPVDNDDPNDSDYVQAGDDDDERTTQSKKITFNSHQCYVCFKLYDTKDKLLNHCQEHFDVCNINMLKKCPLCDFVTNLNLKRHLSLIHKINVTIPYGTIRDRKNNNGNHRFYYKVKNDKINEIEIIPSVKNLNRRAYIEMDKRKRELDKKSLTKTKLVKNKGEWVVERIKIDDRNGNLVMPKLDDAIGADYLEKMKNMYQVVKKNGERMLFPCEKCEKICQTLSALKLHMRKHDPNPKPFKKKIWKHKLSEEELRNMKKKPVVVSKNRYEKPKPIVNKHKCDPKLKDFYEKNIKGGDVEFWQFLKIFNKMSRENINDFSDLENRTEFGIHISVPENSITEIPSTIESIKKSVSKFTRNGKVSFKRTILISRKSHERRKELIDNMRRNIENNAKKTNNIS